MNRRLSLIACAALAAGLTGCTTGAGQNARESLLTPAAQAAWPMVKDNAWRGIDAKVEAGELTDEPDGGTAAFQRETVILFDEAVSKLGGGS